MQSSYSIQFEEEKIEYPLTKIILLGFLKKQGGCKSNLSSAFHLIIIPQTSYYAYL